MNPRLFWGSGQESNPNYGQVVPELIVRLAHQTKGDIHTKGAFVMANMRQLTIYVPSY